MYAGEDPKYLYMESLVSDVITRRWCDLYITFWDHVVQHELCHYDTKSIFLTWPAQSPICLTLKDLFSRLLLWYESCQQKSRQDGVLSNGLREMSVWVTLVLEMFVLWCIKSCSSVWDVAKSSKIDQVSLNNSRIPHYAVESCISGLGQDIDVRRCCP